MSIPLILTLVLAPCMGLAVLLLVRRITAPGSISWIVAADAGEDDHGDEDPAGLGYITYQGVITTDVTAVPEPSTYALMLLGIGAFGLMRQRRIKDRG